MRWVQRIQGYVDSAVRNKGRSYFKAGAVRIEDGAADEVRASVKGSSVYAVEIHLDGDAVVVFCGCPYFNNGKICKHIWAALLEAEAKGRLKRIASAWDPYLDHGLEHDDHEFGESLGDEDEARDGTYDFTDNEPDYQERRTPRRFPKQSKAPTIPAWKEQLAALRRDGAAETPAAHDGPRRILYFVDVAECLAAGTLLVQSVVCRLKKNGEWGQPNFQESWIYNVSQLDASDRQMLALLSGSAGGPDGYRSGVATRHRLPPAGLDVLTPLLCATGRFFLRPENQPDDFALLGWDAGAPFAFRMDVQSDVDAGCYVVTGRLKRENDERPLAEPKLLVPGLAFFSHEVSRFDDGQAFQWVGFLRKNGKLIVPAKHRNDFIAEIAQFPALPPMDFPEDLRIEPGSFAGPPHLTIRPVKEGWRVQQRLQCEITFDYGVKVAESEPAVAVRDPARDRFFFRDGQAEMEAIQRLTGLGMQRSSTWSHTRWEMAPSRLPAAVRALVSAGWHVEAEGKLYRRAGSFNIGVTSGIDWFELRGGAEFEGQAVQLPELLKAVARGENLVRLGDGSYGLLPEDWIDRYRLVAGFGKADDGQIRFTRGQAGLLDALLANQPEVTFDEGFLRLRRELEGFAGVAPADAPSTFKGRLRDYQREGMGWLRFVRRFGFGGCLADDMGLGKTVQVLALLDLPDRRGPALVVAPRSLVFNWKQEAARFAPRLRVMDLTGAGRKDRWSLIQEHDIILTTYGTLRRDAAQLKDIHFDTIVLDEAQAIKNAASESAKAARLLHGEHRLALTGTPIENHLGDLWSLLEFLNPGLLGSAAVFRTQISAAPSGESGRILSKALRPFILRRTKEQVARELPPKLEQTIYCELKDGQRKLYNELRDHYRGALLGRIEKMGIQKSRMHILEALLRLRQAACHPGLIDKSRATAPSAKVDSLIPQLQEVVEGGHKALVFSQFTSLLAIVRKRLDDEKIAYEYLDGKTRDREARVRRFQEDEDCPLFLISLKAGGLGLNLTAAEYVFLLDPWWNPAVEAQAIDRTHRIGQSRHVFAYRLIAKDTVEEKVLELQKSKRDLADAIITADNSVVTALDRETLEILLS